MKEYKLPIGCDVPETIILADGDFPSHPLALELSLIHISEPTRH